MQIAEVEKPLLEEAWAQVARAINSRSPLPILSHVLVGFQGDTLRLFATDLDLGLRRAIPAQISEECEIAVPGKLFGDILSKLPSAPITFEREQEGQLVIKCGRSRFVVQTLPGEEFPAWPESKAYPDINLPQDTFRKMVGHVSRAVAPTDESRAVMTGVLVEIDGDQLVTVSTDGRRLAFAQHILPDGLNQQTQAIIPGKAIAEVARTCTDKDGMLRVRLGEGQLWAAGSSGVEVNARLLEGRFPDWKRVIPDEFQRVCRISRDALASGLKRMLIVAQERQSPGLIVFDLAGERLELAANTPDLGYGVEEIPCVYDGTPLKIAFNGKYVLDALQALACEEVVLDLQDDTRSAVLREWEQESFLHVLMPVRLREAVPEEVATDA